MLNSRLRALNKQQAQLTEIEPLFPSVGASSSWESSVLNSPSMNGRSVPFPKRLLNMIRKEAILNPKIVRWSSDGNAFFVNDEESFVTKSLPRYGFKASKMQSFQRNLNIYGFARQSKGEYASGYTHPQFGKDIDQSQLEWICRENVKKEGIVSKSKRQQDHTEYVPLLQPASKAVTRSSTASDNSTSLPGEEVQGISCKRKLRSILHPTEEEEDSIDDSDELLFQRQLQQQQQVYLQQQLIASELLPVLPRTQNEAMNDADVKVWEENDGKDESIILQNEKQDLIKALEMRCPPEEQTFIRAHNFWSLPHQPLSPIVNMESHSTNEHTPTTLFAVPLHDDFSSLPRSTLHSPTSEHDVKDSDEFPPSSLGASIGVGGSATGQGPLHRHSSENSPCRYQRPLVVSTVRAPYDTQLDYFLDRIYVQRCIPEIPFEGEEV